LDLLLLLCSERLFLLGLLKRTFQSVETLLKFSERVLLACNPLRRGYPLCLKGVDLLAELLFFSSDRGLPAHQAVDLCGQCLVGATLEREINGFQLVLEHLILCGLFCLTTEGTQLTVHLMQKIRDPRHILSGSFEFALGSQTATAIQTHPGGFFHEYPDILSFGVNQRLDAPLLNNGVGFRSRSGPKKKFNNIAQTAGDLVEKIFRVSRPEITSRDHDFGPVRPGAILMGAVVTVRPVNGQTGRGCIFQEEGDIGHAERRTAVIPGKDHITHLLTTEVFGALLAQNPAQGVDNIRLSAAVGTDDGGNSFRKGERRLLLKRFKSEEFELFDPHLPHNASKSSPPLSSCRG